MPLGLPCRPTSKRGYCPHCEKPRGIHTPLSTMMVRRGDARACGVPPPGTMRAMSATASLRLENALRAAASRLAGPDARHEAEQLLLHVIGRDRAWLFAHGDAALADADAAAFEALLARRIAGEPVAYLVGHRGFWTLDLQVSPATLIPRPETERLVELALERLPADRPLRIADLGTGTGALALSLASERAQAQVVATDFSADALAVARANGVSNAIANVEFRHGSWWAPLQGERFHLVASNPPYIADGVVLRRGRTGGDPRDRGRRIDAPHAWRLVAAGARLGPGRGDPRAHDRRRLRRRGHGDRPGAAGSRDPWARHGRARREPLNCRFPPGRAAHAHAVPRHRTLRHRHAEGR